MMSFDKRSWRGATACVAAYALVLYARSGELYAVAGGECQS
jgi:hypothetical protein